MSYVELVDVQVRYGNKDAIRDVTFSVEKGELAVIVGPSGSGKTTVLRAIAGWAPLARGEIRLNGRRLNDVHPRDRDIAMVYQSRALYNHMTVRENWSFPLEAVGYPKVEIVKRVREVAEMLEMTEFLDRYPAQLSGGQQQRVALGRALVRRPTLFLLDEPFGGLDAKLRIQARSGFKKLHSELGVTTLYVTHDQVEAQGMGSRLIVLNEGRVQQVGTPEEIYNDPANRFVAGFIGSPPMNFIECTLSREGNHAVLTRENLRVVLPPAKSARLFAAAPPQRVLLGARPETIRLSPTPQPGAVPVEVYVTEPQGHEIIVDLRFDTHILRVRGDRETHFNFPLQHGDTVYMAIDPERTYVFDGSTGARLA
ncbi:MAG: ABC transporter ATP-binding protein [Anaerolineae bacterium]